MMPEDPLEHFNSKNLLAQKEIENDSSLLALKFRDRKTIGFLFLTKNRTANIKWRIYNEDSGQPILVAGVGKYLDLVKFWDWLGTLIQDFVNLYGHENLNTSYIFKKITQHLDKIYNKKSKALGLELLLLSALQDTLEMTRIKYDGNYHPTPLYAVLGGRKKIDGKNSFRRKVLKELAKAYKKRLPQSSQAENWGKKLLALDPYPGYLQIAKINFTIT